MWIIRVRNDIFRAMRPKNRNFIRMIFLLSFLAGMLVPVAGQSFFSTYFDFADNFADSNTGLTSFPILQIPMGGRYEAMGTAFTALANDFSYLDANPAASALLDRTQLALAHNAWIADTSIDSAVYTIRKDKLGLGLASKFLYVPFTEYDDWGDTQASIYYSETLATANISYNLFSDFYYEGLAVGANLKTAYRNIPAVIEPGQSAFAFMADLGLLTRFNFLKPYSSREKNFSVGLTTKNLGMTTDGEPLPSEASFGLAYSPLRPLTVTTDFNYPFSLDPDVPAERWNVAAGMDMRVTDFFALQSGFHYRGGNPRFSLGSELLTDTMAFNINYTLGLDTQVSAPLDRLSVVASLDLGDRGRYQRQRIVEEQYIAGLEAYAMGRVSMAVAHWEAALELDPDYTPAEENLATALTSLELEQELIDINTLLDDGTE
jgi:tetratricopeptide (TPR) repeat protein